MKSLIAPWQNVSIDEDFGHHGFGVPTDAFRVLWGPFAVLDIGDDFMTEGLIDEWMKYTDNFTIDIRDISSTDDEIIWQWFSNRDHRFVPELEPVFENGVLKCRTTINNTEGRSSYRNYWFREPNELEWQHLAPGLVGREERFKHVLSRCYKSS